uniref:Uncharacterized protein n=1 Tax=Ditylenchus dipsaci TaxID=166011 RepID=A0A915D728_9BILA
MRTIYPNAKAVGLVALVVLLVIFLLISIHKINFHLASMPTDQPSVLIARDVNVRKENGGEIVENAAVTPSAPKLKKSPADKDNKQEVKSEEGKAVVAKPVELSSEKLEDATRREAVVEMIYHTWTGYKNYSWEPMS